MKIRKIFKNEIPNETTIIALGEENFYSADSAEEMITDCLDGDESWKNETDIIDIQAEIFINIDKLNELFSQYIELNNSIKKITVFLKPIIFLRKRNLLKGINIELNHLDYKLDLFNDLILSIKPVQLDEHLVKMNYNIQKMANKFVELTPKYIIVKGKNWNIDNLWNLLQYILKQQDEFAKGYNDRMTNKHETSILLSILEEIKFRSNEKNVDYSIYIVKTYPKID